MNARNEGRRGGGGDGRRKGGQRERAQGLVMTMGGGEGAWHDVEPMRDTLRTGFGAPGLCGLHSNGQEGRRGGQREGGQAGGDDGGVAGRTAAALARHPLARGWPVASRRPRDPWRRSWPPRTGWWRQPRRGVCRRGVAMRAGAGGGWEAPRPAASTGSGCGRASLRGGGWGKSWGCVRRWQGLWRCPSGGGGGAAGTGQSGGRGGRRARWRGGGGGGWLVSARCCCATARRRRHWGGWCARRDDRACVGLRWEGGPGGAKRHRLRPFWMALRRRMREHGGVCFSSWTALLYTLPRRRRLQRHLAMHTQPPLHATPFCTCTPQPRHSHHCTPPLASPELPSPPPPLPSPAGPPTLRLRPVTSQCPRPPRRCGCGWAAPHRRQSRRCPPPAATTPGCPSTAHRPCH